MALVSSMILVSDGTLQTIHLTFPFRVKEDIRVYVRGREVLVNDGWVWSGNNTIRFDTPIPSDVTVWVRRLTDLSGVPHIFGEVSGATGRSEFTYVTVDENFKYILEASQDALDSFEFTRGSAESTREWAELAEANANLALQYANAANTSKQLSEAARLTSEAAKVAASNSASQAATSSTNAANSATTAANIRGEVNTLRQQTQTLKEGAETAASAALVSQNAAKTSETNSKASEVATKASQTSASSSASSASASANTATNAATTATTQARNASSSATSAATSANEASTSATLAKDWATKTDGTVDGEAFSAKYYAQVAEQYTTRSTAVSSIDTPTTYIEGIGSYVSPLQVNVKVSATDGNSLTIEEDGLYATGREYTAGDGITLDGTVFSVPISTSGEGTFVQSLTQTATGIQANLGTPHDTRYPTITDTRVTEGTSILAGLISPRNLKLAVDTHGLKVGTTSTSAKAGDYVPTWSEITGKPTNLVENTTRVIAGTGLTGGGTLAADRELSIENSQVPITATNLGNSNLNDILKPGYYYQPFTANATSERNYPPSLVAGDLVVRTSAGVTQEYTDYQSRRKFYRGFYGGTWNAWREIYTDNSSIPSSKISGFGTAADFNVTTYNADTTPNRLIKTGDFGLGLPYPYDRLWETAFHQVSPEKHPNKLPSDTYKYGALFGIQHQYHGQRAELYITHLHSNDMYVRSSMDSNWSKIYHSGTPPSWGEVTGKPSTFATTWNSVDSKPDTATRWPSWGEVSGKPSTFTPPTDAGGVGTYAFVVRGSGYGYTTWGDIVAGSVLTPSNNGASVTNTLSGTWRIMGSSVGASTSARLASLAVRIS